MNKETIKINKLSVRERNKDVYEDQMASSTL